MYPIAFLFADGTLCFIDALAATKLHYYCQSPFTQARSTFWEDQADLFPAYSPFFPDFYWRHGPQLLLPERAEGLR